MSDKAPPKGALNVERRTWDREVYEKKAKEMLEKQESGQEEVKKTGVVRKREEFQAAPDGAAGPEGSKRAYLSGRNTELTLDEKLGKIQVVTTSAAHAQGGYWCDVCQCLLKDSLNYLDHINGKRHQRALGFSMRVERVGIDRVKARIEANKKAAEMKRTAAPKPSAIKEYEDRLAEQEEEELRKRQERKEARKAADASAKAARKGAAEEEEGEEEGIDPEMAAMMGFGGFK